VNEAAFDLKTIKLVSNPPVRNVTFPIMAEALKRQK